ncbi:MAG: CHAT domain-containing protein [Myxococcota bacterium]
MDAAIRQLDSHRRRLRRSARGKRRGPGGWTALAPGMQLATLQREAGRFKQARTTSKQVLRQARAMLGSGHPSVRSFREEVAILDMVSGKEKRALKELRRLYDEEKRQISIVLATGTERDNRVYLRQRAHQLHVAIALSARYLPRSDDAARLALDAVLTRKGRLLDAAASSMATVRRRMSSKDRAVLDELAAARAQLSRLVVAGPAALDDPDQFAVRLAELEAQIRTLERQLRKRSTVLRAAQQPVELAAVQKAIPADAALLELVAYEPLEPTARSYVKTGQTRYGAYVLTARGAPRWFDLGPARAIDGKVHNLRKALSDPDSNDVVAWGNEVHAAVMGPLTGALGSSKHLLIAPDGALNLVPFGALVGQRGNHLIERFRITYLTSGRDLMRFAVRVKPGTGALIIADPDFDRAATGGDSSGDKSGGTSNDASVGDRTDSGAAHSRGRRSRNLRRARWKRLPGTAGEARSIAEHLAAARLLSGARATESALKRVRAPRVLHLATHGFFLNPQHDCDRDGEAAGGPGGDATVRADPSTGAVASRGASATPAAGGGPENPLLRSGLVFAGVNTLRSGGDDGVLTALEASGLDLWGTELVVLSACETGVGTVSHGEGVYGLRRALVVAGAESLVMSLWQVDDQATRDLMTRYYRRLTAGKGRTDALRQAQLHMLRSDDYSHPYYWAGFIPAGAWTPLTR